MTLEDKKKFYERKLNQYSPESKEWNKAYEKWKDVLVQLITKNKSST